MSGVGKLQSGSSVAMLGFGCLAPAMFSKSSGLLLWLSRAGKWAICSPTQPNVSFQVRTGQVEKLGGERPSRIKQYQAVRLCSPE